MKFSMVSLTDRPELNHTAAHWFHEKWGVPLDAYLESMDAALTQTAPSPAGIWPWRGSAS